MKEEETKPPVVTAVVDIDDYREYDFTDRRMRALWLLTLYGEYRAVLAASLGYRVVAVEVAEDKPRDGDLEFTNRVYEQVFRVMHGFEVKEPVFEKPSEELEIALLLQEAKRTGDHRYYMAAARKAAERMPDDDGYVQITPFRVTYHDTGLDEEEAKRIEALGVRIARMLARLGTRAEPALRTLVFRGYDPRVVDSIEGLSDEEREFLKRLLRTPFKRAALIYAYRHVGSYRRLMREILREIHWGNTYYYIMNPAYVLVLDELH